jgi:hypothetical protein
VTIEAVNGTRYVNFTPTAVPARNPIRTGIYPSRECGLRRIANSAAASEGASANRSVLPSTATFTTPVEVTTIRATSRRPRRPHPHSAAIRLALCSAARRLTKTKNLAVDAPNRSMIAA